MLALVGGMISMSPIPSVFADGLASAALVDPPRAVVHWRGTFRVPNGRTGETDVLDLIESEDVVVTLSHAGYAKRQPTTAYRAQKRGGKGRSATAVKEEDFIERLWVVNTHDTLLTFTSAGRVFWLKVYQLPEAGPNSRGRPIINWIPLEEGDIPADPNEAQS